MTAFATRLSDLGDVGVLGDSPILPWTVYLNDLRVVCDITEGAGMLVHYLQRRTRVENQEVHAHDELDWLGHYVEEGLFLDKMLEQRSFISLASYTTAFDDYYLHEAGLRRTSTSKPRQPMPAELRKLIRRLESQGPKGYVELITSLLEGDDEARNLIADQILRRQKRARRRPLSAFRLAIGDGLLAYVASRNASQRMIDDYVEAAKYVAKAEHCVGVCETAGRKRELFVAARHGEWRPDSATERLARMVFGGLVSSELPPPTGG